MGDANTQNPILDFTKKGMGDANTQIPILDFTKKGMGDANTEIPILDFTKKSINLSEQENDEKWKEMSRKVREACEKHGCFIVEYDEIASKLQEEMLVAMESLFDLPQEMKKLYISPKPYGSYSSESPIVHREGFGIDDAQFLNASRAFTNLMWPQGNPIFCETLFKMSSKLQELFEVILKMIFESFGVGKHFDQFIENNNSLFRVMKYKPPLDHDSLISLPAHTDKNTLTILCQNEVQGLEILSKEGKWSQLMIPKGCFVVIVGDALQAWGNGRLHALKHKVVMSGSKERYSCGLFTLPKEGALVQVPKELVDNEHPLLYKSFAFSDYLSYFVSNSSLDNALDIYAGVV